MSLRLVLHRKIPEDPVLEGQWNGLVLQMERPEVFYTCQWARAMQAAYPASLNPLLLLGYESDDLVGVASLATDPQEKNISFLAATTGDYCEFLSHPSRRAEFVGAVFSKLADMRVDKLVLANLPEDSATPNAIRGAAREHGLHSFLRPAYACSQVDLGVGERRKELKAVLTRKLHRKLRTLGRTGTVAYAHLASWDRIQPALPGFADAHVARFLSQNRVSSLATAERRHFVEDLARRFSDSGVVTLSLLLVNDQPAAWNYGFRFHGSWFWYQPTFDARWEEYSPGYCLLSGILVEACDMEGMRVVDLGLGSEGYKDRFENSSRKTLYVTVAKSWRSHLREISTYRAATLLKQSAKVESFARRVVSRFRQDKTSHLNQKSI